MAVQLLGTNVGWKLWTRIRGALFEVLAACVALAAVSISAHAAATGSANWVLSYEGKSTNRFVWDKRTRSLVAAGVPRKLADEIIEGLGGPPDPVIVVAHRYVSVSACVPHDCGDKAFFWIDTQTGAALGASLWLNQLKLGSTGLTPATLPRQARQALLDWISEQEIRPAAVVFLDSGGRSTTLATGDFQPRPRFQPPPTGPSFDCGAASTAIEKAICGDADLAKIDLDMGSRLKEMRHGYDTLGALKQLTELQRKWLKERDANCTTAANVRNCIKASYEHQRQVLWNWVPR